MKAKIQRFMPAQIIRLYRRGRVFLQRRRNRNRTTEEVFTDIYLHNRWGGKPGEYCSGSGSTEYHASIYAEVVRAFVRAKGISKIVDLGCGDFAVGRRLMIDGVQYIGVDIVPGLIRRNIEKFSTENVSFRCFDIVSEPLPDGELCLLRQVLQHLSNSQIAKVLTKVRKYRWVLVTEHYPAVSVHAVPNRDKPQGADIRVYDNSAVYLDLPPFNMRIARVLLEVRASVDLVNPSEVIRTFLIENEVQSIL